MHLRRLRVATSAGRPMPSPLSAADLAAFDRDGFVVLRDAVPRAVALACRDALWAKLERDRGIARGEPATWAKAEGGRVGLAEAHGGDDLGAPWAACWSPRLVAAVDQLCGEDRWEKPGLGWWVINFPARGGAGAWHVDGAHFTHTLASPEIGLAPILLFSDVAEGGGGTALAPGSHRAVAASSARGARGRRRPAPLGARARGRRRAPAFHSEAPGRAATSSLAHPLLLHARSANLGAVDDADAVRFGCFPNVPMRGPATLRGGRRDAGRGATGGAPRRRRCRARRGGGRVPPEDDALLLEGFARFGGAKKRRRRAFVVCVLIRPAWTYLDGKARVSSERAGLYCEVATALTVRAVDPARVQEPQNRQRL